MHAFKRQLARRLRRALCSAAILILAAIMTLPGAARAETVVIGSTPTGHLMWIADHQRYFTANGVDVKLLEFSSGVAASKALIAGEVHLANSSEFAFLRTMLRNQDLKLIASIARASTTKLFARADSGISGPASLIGKRVGVTKRSIGEFFLAEYLALNGFAEDQVELVDLRPGAIVEEITQGRIDAAITWEPFALKAKISLGENFAMLPEQDSYYYHFVLSAHAGWLRAHHEEATGVLRALLEAQQYAAENPAEAQKIIADRFRLDPVFVRKTWNDYVREVTILQNLISLMEQQTRWLVDQGHIDGRNMPDFLNVLDSAALSEVAPDAVKLIE